MCLFSIKYGPQPNNPSINLRYLCVYSWRGVPELVPDSAPIVPRGASRGLAAGLGKAHTVQLRNRRQFRNGPAAPHCTRQRPQLCERQPTDFVWDPSRIGGAGVRNIVASPIGPGLLKRAGRGRRATPAHQLIWGWAPFIDLKVKMCSD